MPLPLCHRNPIGAAPLCHRNPIGAAPLCHRTPIGAAPLCHRTPIGAAPPCPSEMPASCRPRLPPPGPGRCRPPCLLRFSQALSFPPLASLPLPPAGLFAYCADNLVVLEDLQDRRQRFLHYHASPLAVAAVSHNGRLLAAGPSCAEPSGFADICVWDVESGHKTCVLQYHPVGVQVRGVGMLIWQAAPDSH